MGNSETALRCSNLVLDKSKEKVHDDWNVCPGTLGSMEVTVFSAIHPPSSRKRSFMTKALQGSKIYRHPGLLRFLDGGIIEKEVVVVTEVATPLLHYGIEQMSSLQITAGLSSIIDALVFLHDKAGVSHNNVCASSIYITSDGSWKLWGFEYSCSFGELTRDHIEKINQYCSERSLPPDDKSRISPAYQHSRDCYSLGKLIQDTLQSQLSLDVLSTFEDFMSFITSKALHKDWNKRPRLSSFLEQPFFNHEFIKLRQKLNNILLYSSVDRDEFIISLPSTLRKYSDEAVAITYGPIMFSHSFMLIPSACASLMPCLFIPKDVDPEMGIFTDAVYKEVIIPLVLNLFEIHDATVRKILLGYFHHFVSFISKEILRNTILPQILLGIRDIDESLVSSSLKCLASLVPLLGADIVIGKNREQIFTTATPKKESSKKIKDLKRKKLVGEQKSQEDQSLVLYNFEDLKEEELNSEPTDNTKSNNSSRPVANFTSEQPPYLDIPERSSPDGGEVTDDIFLGTTLSPATGDTSFDLKEEDNWSDWEDTNRDTFSDIKDILMIHKKESSPSTAEHSSLLTLAEPKDSSEYFSCDPSSKGSAMKLKSGTKETTKNAKGLGHEFDIMSLKINKKPDAELDFFADLKPNLRSKDFDLEKMLIDASEKSCGRDRLPSLSDTLAQMQIDTNCDNDGWGDEDENADWKNQTSLYSQDLTTLDEDLTTLDSQKILDYLKKIDDHHLPELKPIT